MACSCYDRVGTDLSLFSDVDPAMTVYLYETINCGTVSQDDMAINSGAQINAVFYKAVGANFNVIAINQYCFFADNCIWTGAPA